MLNEVSASTFKGTLNKERTVYPSSNREAAIPDVATARAILPSDLTFAKIVLYKKVLPVPYKNIIY